MSSPPAPSTPAPARRPLLPRLALLVGSTLVALLLAEGLVRVMGLAPPERPSREGRLLAPTGDPDVPRAYIPDAVRTHAFPRPNGSPPLRTTTHVNAVGLRGPAFGVDKPDGVVRIACLGDSFTFGYGVEDEDTWPARLQGDLERHRTPGSDTRYEVWNFAVEGTDTLQQVARLERRVLPVAPDHVLLAFYLNDVRVEKADAEDDDASEGTGARTGAETGLGSGDLRAWMSPGDQSPLAGLRKRSALVDLLTHRIYVSLSLGRYAELYTAAYADDAPGWTRVRDALRRARDLLAERGVAFTVLTYPMLAQRGDGFGSDEAYARVHAFCAAEGIDCLDLSPALAGLPVESLRLHDVDQHPNGLANTLVAGVIAAHLLGEEAAPDR